MDRQDIHDAQIDLMREILERGGTFSFRAFGHSMFPMILPGTDVTVRPLRTQPPPIGTVLVAERDGMLVCHRLVRLHREGDGRDARWIYHLRGDNHSFEDPPFDQSRILGEVESLRFGKFGISTDFAPYRLTGSAWALFPRPARVGLGVVRRLLEPGRRLAETCHGLVQRVLEDEPEIGLVGAGRLDEFQARAVHLGVAWNRDRSSILREDLEEGRALLVEARRQDETVGALLAVTGEISSAAWLEFLRLAYPRRGTGIEVLLLESAFEKLANLRFTTLHTRSDSPLSERRLRSYGFSRRENLGPRGWSWVRRL